MAEKISTSGGLTEAAANTEGLVTVSRPKDFTSVNHPCIFEFDRAEKASMLIYIAGQSKNIIGIAPTVNVADYFRYEFLFTPIVSGEEFSIVSAISLKRVIVARVQYNVGTIGYETEATLLSASTSDITERKGLLSDILHRHIGKGQIDEFTLISKAHSLAIIDNQGNNLLTGDVVMKKAVFISTDERYKLSLSTGPQDCDLLAIRMRLTLNEDILTKQVLYYGGCIVWIENGKIYVAPQFTNYDHSVDYLLSPNETLDLWIVAANTDDVSGTGSNYTVSVLFSGKTATYIGSKLTFDRINIGGHYWTASLVYGPFKGIFHSVEVHRVDDNPDNAYILLAAISNPDVKDDDMPGIESILQETRIASYTPETLDLNEKKWHDNISGIDLEIKGEIAYTGFKNIPPGMQVISLPINQDCKVVIEDAASNRQIIEYICRNYVSGVRLAWLNRFGAIDQYNFEILAEQSTEVERTAIYTRFGYLTTDLSADDYTTVTTRALPAAQVKAMTDILVSDHVFLIENGQFTEVDVVSDSATTSSNNSLTTLTVKFRPKKRRL